MRLLMNEATPETLRELRHNDPGGAVRSVDHRDGEAFNIIRTKIREAHQSSTWSNNCYQSAREPSGTFSALYKGSYKVQLETFYFLPPPFKAAPPALPMQKLTTESKPLKRGKACLTCRFLKIKCDGTKPVCGPCLRHPKDDPCEYADSPRRSRTKVLEDQVARLEARLKDLEQPDQSPSVTLHDPYSNDPYQNVQVQSLAGYAPSTSDTFAQSPSSPYSASTSLSITSTPPPGSASPISSRTDAPPFNVQEPSTPVIRDLLDLFFSYSAYLGFFLDVTRFYNSAVLPLPLGHQSRPSSSVLSAVYLWGSHLSSQRDQKGKEQSVWAHQHQYLASALKHVSTGLTNTHPDRFLHTIQAEVLLAYYFLRIGNFLEARRHTGDAVSLAVGCGLHRLRSEAAWRPPAISVASFIRNGVTTSTTTTLPPPRDSIEEGERIDAFWNVLILAKTLAIALDCPTDVCGTLEAPGFQIDTPWPLDQKSYQAGILPHPTTCTVHTFLHPTPNTDTPGSLLTLTAQASILLQQVTYFAGQSNLGESHE
ncbi:uncharacterized protein BT62DRAFT_1078508 [Guyanagaster necrorhizus]|uniref:Zn(2)-C6 fungal-type domain-containing protein n=1 Tax=Guyanagaster necrorhizus TaxID=856835 RepID=A0A9P7VLN1_9AGAR|nr:uncharacterized protein BT62DRAFT_1078508 [Guyanagaster necrorhizus MCA 3950]KAG7443443.1 hypothetical protein BT62DRAFT_1078508 [Guyanagaster necrorhizus MCA 3950]